MQFKIPLAKPFKDLKSLKGRWALQTKMDGGRVVARLSSFGGKVKLLSRTGKEWKGFDDIKASLQALNKEICLPVDSTLDGEVVIFKNGRMDFQAAQKMFHADDGRAPDGDMQYVMFDFATNSEYDNPKTNYDNRFYNLNEVVKPHLNKFKNLKIIDSEEVIDPKQAMLDERANKYVSELGCDGAIIRRLDKPPTNKKTSDITKVKPFLDAECVVIGKVEGKGWLEGSLGTVECQLLVDGKQSGPMFEIGTGIGFTKELRQELWDDKELIGKIVNFKYQRMSDDNVPVLTTFRAIRHPNDL